MYQWDLVQYVVRNILCTYMCTERSYNEFMKCRDECTRILTRTLDRMAESIRLIPEIEKRMDAIRRIEIAIVKEIEEAC